MTVSYRPRTSEIPTQPGVYRFFDTQNRVLYVGKAKNLRNRVTSYFAPLDTLHERTRRMVTSAANVEWVIVGSEFEALQLEFTWIKEFNPPFNIQFKDDKSYPYLAITVGEETPRVTITRNKNIPHAKYFGPFTKTWAIRETLDLLLPVFPIRSCSDGVFAKAKKDNRPCLLGDIGRCAAPCTDRISQSDHKSLVMDFVSFMNGNNEPYVNELTERMSQASLDQDYERAAILRDNISALKTVASKSAIVLSDSVDTDIFGIAADGLSAAVQQFIVREGRIRGVHSWSVDTELDVSEEELIDNMLRTAYQQDMVPPKQIYIPSLPEDAKSIQEWLTSIKHERSNVHSGLTVKLKVAQRGEIAALAATVSANAQQALLLYKTRRSADYVTRTQALSDIQDVLGLSESPLRIECFDISHLSGTNTVASMVVFEDGLAKKSDYRKFIIKNPRDDTAAMSEVISRRGAYLTGKEKDQDKREGSFAYPPGLFVVDGGVPQVNAAAQALHSAGIDIPVVGIAKRLEELWLPNNPYPVILPRNSEALFLLQKLRDEAHRFALTFQRQKRSSSISSALSDINGLGPKKVALLLKHFTSLTQIKNASIEEISTVQGISEHLAREIKRQLTRS